jgi:hypothetical protein
MASPASSLPLSRRVDRVPEGVVNPIAIRLVMAIFARAGQASATVSYGW